MTISARTAAASCLIVLAAGFPVDAASQPTPADSTEEVSLWSETPFVEESNVEESKSSNAGTGCGGEMWCWENTGIWAEMESWEDCSNCWPTSCFAGCGSGGWTATADAMLLQRSTARSREILFVPAFGLADVVALNVDDLAFGFEVGPRVNLSRRLGRDCTLEIGYFGIFGWTASAVRDGNPLILFPNPLVAFPPGVMYSTQMAVEYTSDLQSGEVNFRERCNDRIELLAGLRWVELEENFHVEGADATPDPTPRFNTHAVNSMYGMQIGTYAKVFDRGGRFTVDGFLKTGVFANEARQRSVSLGNLGTAATATDSKHDTAFLGEIGLTGVWRLTDRWTARVGYQAMWITGIALAPDQTPFMSLDALDAGVATLSTDGSLFYHGGHVGFEVRW